MSWLHDLIFGKAANYTAQLADEMVTQKAQRTQHALDNLRSTVRRMEISADRVAERVVRDTGGGHYGQS